MCCRWFGTNHTLSHSLSVTVWLSFSRWKIGATRDNLSAVSTSIYSLLSVISQLCESRSKGPSPSNLQRLEDRSLNRSLQWLCIMTFSSQWSDLDFTILSIVRSCWFVCMFYLCLCLSPSVSLVPLTQLKTTPVVNFVVVEGRLLYIWNVYSA